jgi:23S rRNA maturation-related 3'-5' exoribonuclease YhaM
MDLIEWAEQTVEETRKLGMKGISALQCILEENRNTMTREEIAKFKHEIAETKKALKKLDGILIHASNVQKLFERFSQS